MKLVMYLFVGIFLLSFVSAVIPDDCEDSIISYWRFENIFKDSFGANDGVGSGAIDWDDTQMVGSAGIFGGVSGIQKVTVPSSSDLNLDGRYTVELFIQESDSLNSDKAYLVKKGNYGIKSIRIDDDYFSLESAVYDSYTNKWVNVSSGELNLDTNYHVAMTWNGTTLQLYINGAVVGMAPLSDTEGTSSDLVFGDGFYGLIDEIAFYDDALSTNTIRSHYYRGVGKKDYCDASGASGVSSTSTDFIILGCSVSDSSGTYGIAAGSCSKNGRWFCESVGNPLNTLTTIGACSMGSGSCCPSGFKCNDSEICEPRTIDCTTFTTEPTCEGESCFWIEKDGKGFCTERPSDFSCSYYDNEPDCGEDMWNLGQEGTGTEICGTYFVDNSQNMGYVVPQDSCKCAWDATDKECYFSYDVGEEFFSGTQSKLTCFKNYTAGACENGRQHINWNVTLKNVQGTLQTDSALQTKISAVSYCTNGELDRSCGDAIVKMMFFGWFQFIAASLLIGLFYWFRQLR